MDQSVDVKNCEKGMHVSINGWFALSVYVKLPILNILRFV